MADESATARQLLERADKRWRAQAGDARFEDAPIRPARQWRQLPPPTMWTASSSAALCADVREKMEYVPGQGRYTRRKVDDDKVRAMWSLGWSDAQIARTIGVAPASIGSARKRMRLAPNYSGRGCLK